VAYVDIDQFNENTSHELEAALRGWRDAIKGRSSTCGKIQVGCSMKASRGGQVPGKGQTIVSHRGRASAEKTIPRGTATAVMIIRLWCW